MATEWTSKGLKPIPDYMKKPRKIAYRPSALKPKVDDSNERKRQRLLKRFERNW